MSSLCRNGKWLSEIKSEKGSVAIEFFFYFLSVVLLCFLLVDYGRYFLNKGYMERINHSLATVLRERTVLYHGKERLTQDDVNQLDLLAKMLLAESHIGEKYNLYVDAIYFDEGVKTEKKMKGKPISFTVLHVTDSSCPKSAFAADLTKRIPLSPFSHAGTGSTRTEHWLPVYQVTLCTQGQYSVLMKILRAIDLSIGNISVSNAVIPR
ncbi:tight adherence pilus pseudopilin TadF [Candidatus Symbiopectobacterium sp. NZEC135]|uniref:tight adherence pilus pseudopilin TadF n=1 Tax=Candidatus Symbiopectobacterium sp. NZEC135 TaxID=2820471 RepID=UPI00222677D2|nr:tight adherence pilus pseudopilin TadF [Candidatus Symbiopectobacterium sp. NZEC135]MCW2480013.1 hypothetical protein [Candidatus Symbiopectobacterium sp. NZEC135]